MDQYLGLFKTLDLPLQRSDSYKGAEQYARNFTPCSVLENYHTFYSVDSVGDDQNSQSSSFGCTQSYSSVVAK